MQKNLITLAVITALCAHHAAALNYVSDKIVYNLMPADHTCRVLGIAPGEKITGELRIPESVTVPATVTDPDKYAGTYTVTTIGYSTNGVSDAPESLSVFDGQDAITSVVIPHTVHTVGHYAFLGADAIEKFIVSASNQWYRADAGRLFMRTGDTKSLVAFPAGEKAVSWNMPESCTGIEAGAFAGCSTIKEIRLSESLTIMPGAFYGATSLSKFTGKLTRDGLLLDSDGTELLAVPPAYTTGVFTIPAGVTRIGNGACMYGRMSHVAIPGIVTSIGARAFQGTSFATLEVPPSVTKIGSEAFAFNTSLTKVTLKADPGNASSIFLSCTSLSEVNMPEHVKSLGARIFSGCRALESFTMPLFLESLDAGGEQFAFSGLKSIVIAERITDIPKSCFRGCAQLTSLTMDKFVKSIGSNAFEATALTDVTTGTATSIGSFSFLTSSNSIDRVVIPDNGKKLFFGTNVFALRDKGSVYIDAKSTYGQYGTEVNWPSTFNDPIYAFDIYITQPSKPEKFFKQWNALYVVPDASGYGDDAREMYRIEPDFSYAYGDVTIIPSYPFIEIESVKIQGYNCSRVYIDNVPTYKWRGAGVELNGSMDVDITFTANGVKLTSSHHFSATDGILESEVGTSAPRLDGRQLTIPEGTCTIFDTFGRKVMSAAGPATVDLSALPRGIYVVSCAGHTIKIML